MAHHDLRLLDDYEVIGTPVVSANGLAYVPWVVDAVKPYNATRLPHCTVHGLWDALRGRTTSADPGSGLAPIA
jgi:hypothetical protein